MSEILIERAKKHLALLEKQIATHAWAVQRYEEDRLAAMKAADEVRTFIRLAELYGHEDNPGGRWLSDSREEGASPPPTISDS